MAQYQPRTEDRRFILDEVLRAHEQLRQAEDGGQGLPWFLQGVLYEWLSAANHGWTMAPGLLHGAYECLKHHGSEDLRQRYLSQIATGEWLATMCLTEPSDPVAGARVRLLPELRMRCDIIDRQCAEVAAEARLCA